MRSDWLQQELARELAPVQAPDELWRRVASSRTTTVAMPRQGRSPVFLLSTAAAILVTAGGIWFWANSVGQKPITRAAEGACYVCHTTL